MTPDRTSYEHAHDLLCADDKPERKPLKWTKINLVLITVFVVFCFLIIYANYGR